MPERTIMRRTTRAVLMLGCLSMALAASADEPVYKSIDATGAVSYGDQPAADAVATKAIDVEQGPSEADIEQAQARADEAIERADRLAGERAERQQKQQQAAQQNPPTVIYIDRGDERPGYGYPVYPGRPPGHMPPGHRPPTSWPGPGDHPAYRPGHPAFQEPYPPGRPAPPTHGTVRPIR